MVSDEEKDAIERSIKNQEAFFKERWVRAEESYRFWVGKDHEGVIELRREISGLQDSLKNYKKTFNDVEKRAGESIAEMRRAKDSLYEIINNFDPDKLDRLRKVLELMDGSYDDR